MSALLESLAKGLDPAADAGTRAELDAVLQAGLPGPRSERWRYTSLRALERRSFDPTGASGSRPVVDPALLAHIPLPRIVFVNGVLAAELGDTQAMAQGMAVRSSAAGPARSVDGSVRADQDPHLADHVFSRLNHLLSTDGVQVDVADGHQTGVPLHLVSIGMPDAADRAWHLRHDIRVGRGAAATVVEHHLSAGAPRHFSNSMVHVHVAEDATLTHVRVQDDAAGTTQIARTDAVLDDRARYVRLDLELGAALSRHELNVELRGVEASATCNGVLLGTGARHLDTRIGVQHLSRDGACDLAWRGLAAARSRAVFHGGITIHAGADGTRANLSNKNLLLSDSAEIDTQPVLVIHADEVQAAHGATVGQLDDNALFYMRSRGLPLESARALLTGAFCRETLDVIEDADLRAMLDAQLTSALGRVGS